MSASAPFHSSAESRREFFQSAEEKTAGKRRGGVGKSQEVPIDGKEKEKKKRRTGRLPGLLLQRGEGETPPEGETPSFFSAFS